MSPLILIAFGLVAVTALSALVARRFDQPHSIVLVVVGLVLALIPGLPRIVLDPELVLLLFLPPLLYTSGVGMSWRGFKADLQPIMLLAVGCVLFTAGVVAATAHWLLGVPWAVGFVLGAVVSPPDAVAPMAIARRLAVPSRVLTILEGEGLVNDATALILFSFAVGAVVDGHAQIGKAALTFVAIVAGELAWGVLLGYVALRLRRWTRDPQVELVLALLTPFLAFWPPELVGGSGVLATVTTGLYVSWNGRRFIAPATRLQGYFVWGLVVYLVEGVVFLLTGLQAHVVADGLGELGWSRVLIASGVVTAVVIVVRFLWVYPATYLPHHLLPKRMRGTTPAPPWQYPFIIGFTGIRGVVSLAAALSIPLTVAGRPFPERNLILLATFSVILATLVGQGSTFAWVVRKLGLAAAGEREAAEAKKREIAARITGVEAVMRRLDELEADGAPDAAVTALRRQHDDRRAHLVATIDDAIPGSPAADAAALQLKLVEAERAEVARLYDTGELDDEARRRIERELDLEDARAHHAAQSAGPPGAEP